jgi:hypothetical protein
LDCFFCFFSFVINLIVTEARDTNCVVVLAGTLSRLIEKRSSHGLSDRLREGKG